jgi:hypothetical protein
MTIAIRDMRSKMNPSWYLVYMKGGRYEQMVEHGVCKQEAEV